VRCKLCNRNTKGKLCKKHDKTYMWDSTIQGFRLKKRTAGSRYTQKKYHKTETVLVKLLEQIYGKTNEITSYHPLWAESPKGVLYEFDVYIKGTNLLIEYNGRQHYEYVPFFHKTKKRFFLQKRRDLLKQQLASSHGHKVITFKYDEPITRNHVYNKMKMEY